MPTYIYGCSNCDIEFEIFQGINDLACADCPACLSITKKRIPQPFSMFDKTPKTIGGLADLRRKEMGEVNYQETVQKMANERKQLIKYAGKIPEGASVENQKNARQVDMSLANMTPEQTKKYIFEGKKPIPKE